MEIEEAYPAAINALEERLRSDPSEAETVIRLGFNLWYAIIENDRMQTNLPVQTYAIRFMELFNDYRQTLTNNADFCWAFGQGMNMFWYYFPKATEELGKSLIDEACRLDDFWAKFWTDSVSDAQRTSRLKGRGILEKYYAVK